MKPENERRTKILQVCVSKNELEKMEEVAQLCGLKTSTWLRALAMQLIRDGRGIVR